MDPLALLFGLALGIVLGLLGGGGALLAIPALVYGFHLPFRLAVSGSLLMVLVGTLPAIWVYVRRGWVAWPEALMLGLGGAAGSWGGSQLSAAVPEKALTTLLVALMVASAWAMLRPQKTLAEDTSGGTTSSILLLGVGLSIGLLTGLVGVGGGFLLVPALVLIAKRPSRQAIATSLVVIAANASFGVLGYWPSLLPNLSLLAPMVLLVPLGSLIGAKLSSKLSPSGVKQAFGVLLLVLAALLVWRPG